MTRQESDTRNNSGGWLYFLSGLGIGAAIMYVADQESGTRRRALLREQLGRACNQASMYTGKISRDLANQAKGRLAETMARFRPEPVTDDVLVERVRAELGRHGVHDGALDISARGGRVTLRGPAVSGEVDEVLSAVSSVRGVKQVENQLAVNERGGDVPNLQGEPASNPQ